MIVALAQYNFTVGAIEANGAKIATLIAKAATTDAALVIFPELALCGYPPEDLLYRPEFIARIEQVLAQLQQQLPLGVTAIIGTPSYQQGRLYNSAAIMDREQIRYYHKQQLPNYGVFDERRYFTPGDGPSVIELNGLRCGITICEDIWFEQVIAATCQAGAELIITLNASPFHRHKSRERQQWLSGQARQHQTALLYLNLVGGQDELVFDGDSMAFSASGEQRLHAEPFCEQLLELQIEPTLLPLNHPACAPPLDELELIRRALTTGLRDYVAKNGIPGVVLGLSGGIDSALTLLLAVEALGPERVIALAMPSRYSADISTQDAQMQAEQLGVALHTLPIESPFSAFLELLQPLLSERQPDITEENIQARCRGVLVMAVANRMGYMALTTGNKSEMAVGYATLYGDMAGGFSLLKDLLKTDLYRLSRYLNRQYPQPVIPQRVIERPPSAELAPNQKDSDSLPDYAILDAIIERYVEQQQSVRDIAASGIELATVERIVQRLQSNEHKRRQAAPGVKISARAFGRDRRYPITNHWREHLTVTKA
ncbi:NAD+ synthase [Ectothiorhodospiraceae bacterium BW-2]|nr:NAD+ synthase [Ectothiorhodospiraceae bacterium BW-2]